MAHEIPPEEPTRIYKGDTVKWTKNLPDYLPDDGWTLTYDFVLKGDHQTVVGSDNGDASHLVAMTPAESNKFVPGQYRYVGYVDDGTDRHTVTRGTLDVKAEFDQRVAGYDGRSWARQMLECVEAVLRDKASDDQLSMSVGGRSVTVMAHADLIALRSQLRAEIHNEEVEERLEQGLDSGNKIGVRFPGTEGISQDWRTPLWPYTTRR